MCVRFEKRLILLSDYLYPLTRPAVAAGEPDWDFSAGMIETEDPLVTDYEIQIEFTLWQAEDYPALSFAINIGDYAQQLNLSLTMPKRGTLDENNKKELGARLIQLLHWKGAQ